MKPLCPRRQCPNNDQFLSGVEHDAVDSSTQERDSSSHLKSSNANTCELGAKGTRRRFSRASSMELKRWVKLLNKLRVGMFQKVLKGWSSIYWFLTISPLRAIWRIFENWTISSELILLTDTVPREMVSAIIHDTIRSTWGSPLEALRAQIHAPQGSPSCSELKWHWRSRYWNARGKLFDDITKGSHDVRAPVLCSGFPKIYTAGLDHVFNHFHCMSSALMPM